MRPMTLSFAILVAAVWPALAGPASYVLLRDTDTDSLVRVSSDGKIVTSIADHAAGVGLAAEAAGTYIVGARSALLRVTRRGLVTKVADAPAEAAWGALAIDAHGDIIVADGNLPVLWRVTPDGKSVAKIATLNAISYTTGGRATAVSVDANGDYLWLIEGIVDHRRGFETRFFRVTPGGGVTEIRLSGLRTYSPTSLISGGAGSYLFIDHDRRSGAGICRLTSDGNVTRFANLPEDSFPFGLARNAETGEFVVSTHRASGLTRVAPDGSAADDLVDFYKTTNFGVFATAVIAEAEK